jgi:type I restriction enzyme, S subunit
LSILESRLPDSWRRVTVEEIRAPGKGMLVSGPFGSNIGKRFFVEDGIPVIRGNNLTLGRNRFVDDGFVFITQEKADELRNCQAIAGDLVFTAAGTLGQVGLIPPDSRFSVYVVSNKQLRLRGNPDLVSPEYLYYWFSSPDMRAYVANQNTGASIPLITLGTLRSLPVNLPPLRTQRKIAAILSAYDDLMEVNIRRIALLEEMARGLYREWFVRFRFPGHEGVRMVESAVGLVPAGWEVVTLGNIADINAAAIKKGSEPEWINYVDISSVSPGKIDKIESMLFVEAPGRARRLVKHGDIIWSTVRPNRRSYALILNPPPDMVVSTGFAVITPRDVPFSYLYHALTTDEFAGYLTNHATGSAYPAVNAGDFESALIVGPPADLLENFDKVVSDMLAQQQVLHEKNANLRRTRDLLLPRLVAGEADVAVHE